MQISIIGLGFVGLVTALTMANKGIKVTGVEIDEKKISLLKQGKAPIFEPQINDLLNATLGKTFEVTNDVKYAIQNTDLIFICVGTPSNSDGSADLSFIKQTAVLIGKTLKDIDTFKTFIIKSTIPPGTTENIIKKIIEHESTKKAGIDFGLMMNPEFIKEGAGIEDTLHPHLIVIGTSDEKSKKILHELYESIHSTSLPPILDTTIPNAELIKYANNSFLATKISFINTIANICNRTPGTNVEVIAKALGYDPRIGPLFLKAGPGYGGSCFPKDVPALLNFSKSVGYDSLLLESTHQVNQKQPYVILEMLQKQTKTLEKLRCAILGIAFKKNTDDIRDAVSLKIIMSLLEKNNMIRVHDPFAMENLKKAFNDRITYCENAIDCITGTDCCIVLTDWDEYKNLSANDFKQHMKNPIVVDARRIFNPEDMRSIQFSTVGYCE